MLEPKDFMKKAKLIFYQLFNRKLPFVVFDATSFDRVVPTWLFTNIDYETILMYDSKPDYFCSSVMILDKEFAATFYELFPLLRQVPCIVRVVDFLSALSKATNLTQCSLNLVMNDIVLTYIERDHTVDKVIGTKLLDIDVEMYKKVYESGIIPHVLPGERVFKAEDLQEDKFITTVDDGAAAEGHVPRQVRVIIQVGLTVPCLPLIVKNDKETDPKDQSCTLRTGYDGDSVLSESHYISPLVCCHTTQPAQRWFVKRINS